MNTRQLARRLDPFDPPYATEGIPPEVAPGEQMLRLSGVTWQQYEQLYEAFYDSFPGLRMTYLEGELQLMTIGPEHEATKKTLARLLELYALEKNIELNGYGQTTFKRRAKKRGLEPDECYYLGAFRKVPDIAIEVSISRGDIDKLEVYRGLGVPEVWIWRKGQIAVYRLWGKTYRLAARSGFLPDLDLDHLVSFIGKGTQSESVRAYRDWLRRAAGQAESSKPARTISTTK